MRAADRAAWTKRLKLETPSRRAPKYHARRTTVDGVPFDSAKEGRRYRELKLRVAAGDISGLEVRPRFPIDVVELYKFPPWAGPMTRKLCGVYTADFLYITTAGEVVVEDVKSGPTKTTAYRLRKRLVEAIHGITIREV